MRGCNNSWVLHLTDLPNPRIQSANRRQVQLVPLAKRRQAIVQSLRPGRPRENRASEADVRSVPHHHQRSVPRSQHRRTNRAVGQNATCDPLNGLRCYNSEQTTKMCHDYEIRVLCWSAECTVFSFILLCVCAENQTCTDGEGWDNCAYLCDELCDYTARSSFGCDDSVSRTCVPGCKSLESLLCQPGEKRLNSTTCVPQEMCPCLKPDGTRAMPFETWKNPADSCSDCSCHSNAALCTVHDLTCTGVTPSATPTAQPGVSPNVQPACGWSAWMNVDKPSTGGGDVESLTLLRSVYSICDKPLMAQCRDAATQHPAPASVVCDVQEGLICTNADHAGLCSDYEIRVYCPCPVPSAVPTNQAHSQPTPATTVTTVKPVGNCVSGWSAWFNNDSPNTGDGDVEKMTSQQLSQFCAGGRVSQVDCRTTGGIEYFSSGEIVTCTVDTGLVCNNADNDPIPCSDYEIRYECSCPGRRTNGSLFLFLTALPSPAPSKETQGVPTPGPLATTAAPTGNCISGWSAWFNNDSPDTGDGDVEKMTSQQLSQFCAGGRVSQVDCRTTEGIEYFSSGEIVTCTVDTGLVCNNADNDPIPCSDYEIRYECSCLGIKQFDEYGLFIKAPTTPAPTKETQGVPTPGPLATTAAPTGNCVSGWSAWFNNDSPDTGDGDVEKMTPQQLSQFCAGGRVSQVDCRTTEGIEYFSSGEIVTCTVDTGLVCNNADNDPIPCSDYEIRYECSCPETQGIPTTPGPLATTAAPTGNCISGWSAWFNNDSPDTGDGDVEKITPQQLSQFCAGGRVSQVDCRTTEGIEYFSSGEMLTCTVDGGLVCNNADNDPVPCSDYKIRYECSCPAGASPAPEHTQRPSTAAVAITTAAAPRTCVNGWSAWINNDSPDTGDGDVEKMTSQQLSQFCPGGRVTQVDCRTTEDIEYFSSGEMLTCTVDGGLVCNNADNDPIPCSDYKIRYECSCHRKLSLISERGYTHENFVSLSLTCAETGECVVDMGMTNGNIRDDMISASSFRDVTHAPQKARLNSLSSWMPSRDDLDQFIQVDLLAPHFVTGVTTQGRFDAPSYVTSYKVTFSTDGVNWNVYREEENVDKMFESNKDSMTPVTSMFQHPIRARYIRINPLSWEGRIALRIELHGCFEDYPGKRTKQNHASYFGRLQSESELYKAVSWDAWVDTHQPGLTSRDDFEPIDKVREVSLTCRDPLTIQCRTATADHTMAAATGQSVRCNLWDGLLCLAADVKEQSCFNYEVRLGCVRQTADCRECRHFVSHPTAHPTSSAMPCYSGLDLTSCPPSCPAGQYCDGATCVTRSECPCLVDGKMLRARDVATNGNCETCQCLNGELRCLAKTCATCSQGMALLNKNTCRCECIRCSDSEFQCGNGQCLPLAAKCDGVIDCQEDELNCLTRPTFIPPSLTPTSGGQAIPSARPDSHLVLHPSPLPRDNSSCPAVCPKYSYPSCPEGNQVVEILSECSCTKKACSGRYMVRRTVCKLYLHFRKQWASRGFLLETRMFSCKEGEVRVNSANQCCGSCQVPGCLFNGTVYKAGQPMPSSRPCYTKSCERDDKKIGYVIQETRVRCKPLDDVQRCFNVSYLSLDLIGNATDLTCTTCSPQPTYASPDDTIGHVKVRKSDGVLCSNAVALTGLQQCQGQCGASDDTCSCCRPTVTTRRHVPLRCDDGSSMKHSYVVVHACQCGACGGE
ncbi:hypothetical protein C0Q70_10127 [Pomacea canaliculata]|uniref:F5/8 type C domain-containing protein n=1 Tax=Pomacea canaliculata TaxID=400727 RepID=A0A2T7PBR8_POMCA|nr:hypothetical protein C0Q70_10127 [Pomacea canaliculata]